MKKLTLLMIMIASLTTTHELYAQGNSGKDKPERDKPERDKPEKKTHEKNIKAEDAQKNWGQLKDEVGKYNEDELKDFLGLKELSKPIEDYTDKEIKEAIKAKKRVRNEIRKEMEKNPDLDLSLIKEYDPNHPNDLEKLVQKLIGDYSHGEVNETLDALKFAGMSDTSINKIEKSLLKYNENLDIPAESADETKTSSEDTEEIEIKIEV